MATTERDMEKLPASNGSTDAVQDEHVKPNGVKDDLENGPHSSDSEHGEKQHLAHLGIDPHEHYVHEHMNPRLFLALLAMSFLWVGSQIPLYLFGSILPLIYSDIGGADRWVWAIIGYLIPCAGLCPFVGALSDMFGRRNVGLAGQCLLILGPIVTSTAKTMNIAIAGMVFSGLGAGLNELIALSATGEMVPISKRGAYVGAIVCTILPFCPSALWSELIASASDWRYVGILVGVWNFIGFFLLLAFYHGPKRTSASRPRKEILHEIDYIGGFLSTIGVLLFMMGMQWGATQYSWHSTHVLIPFIMGIFIIIAFFIWEVKFAPFPMVPPKIFSRSKRTMVLTLLITFFSGGNFFVLLLFWPTEVYNVYPYHPIPAGVRTLPIGFGIIGGAVIGLVMISVLRGRTTIQMIFCCALMTAGTGAMSIATTNNISTVYGILTIASIGVGAVIIPCSIIAQIVAPPEFIGTITAITLSIRYIGGAVGFTAYYNVFYHKFVKYATLIVGNAIVDAGISFNQAVVTEMVTLAAQAQFENLHKLIATSPDILDKSEAFGITIKATEQAFVLAYRWPYWISIAFGGVCLIFSLGLKDIRQFL